MFVKVIIVSILSLLGTDSKSVSDPRWTAPAKVEKRSINAVVRDNFILLPANERISKRSLDSAMERDVLVELPASERISKRSLGGLVASRSSFELPAFEKISKRSVPLDGDSSDRLPGSEKISKRSLGGLIASRNFFELPAFERISKRSLDAPRTRRKPLYKLRRRRRFSEGSYTGGLTFDSWMGRL